MFSVSKARPTFPMGPTVVVVVVVFFGGGGGGRATGFKFN